MKVKNVKVGIKRLEEGLQDFTRAFKAAQSGHIPKKPKQAIYFVSLDAMRKVLTSRRVALLHTVREKSPGSVYELARLVKRNLKNVQEDISILSRLGLVALTRTKTARGRLVPHVGYDNLQLQIRVA